MIASVIMPTRDRLEMAVKSIESLGEGDYEVLLYVDNDDPQLEGYKRLGQRKNVRVFVQPRLTYYKFQEMVNFLSKKAKGDWLLLWNDDAYMKSSGWDKKLATYDHNKIYVARWWKFPQKLNLFPAITRKMYKVQGFYSLSPHCDSWVQDISTQLGCEVWFDDIEVEHIRDENSLSDDTKKHSSNAYAVTSPEHNSPEMQDKLQYWVLQLKKHL